MLVSPPMSSLSLRARESIKTGLAMAITIAIALRMDFLEPAWAGFAVAMISLDTAGQSLNKAAMRIAGTLVAFTASLTFLGLFPQQRWAMLLALTPYIALCTYMFTGERRQYAWYVAAFVCLTIMVHGGVDSVSAFRYAVARVEETVLGIAVYSMVSIFLWPQNGSGALEAAARASFQVQLRLFRAYSGLLAGRGRDEETLAPRLEAGQRLTEVGQTLAGAETDTYQVWELRYAWRRFLQASVLLQEALGRFRVSLPEVRALDLSRLLPGTDAFLAELGRRFAQIDAMLAGREPEAPPRSAAPDAAEDELRARSHFERAAVALFASQLRKLDEVSRTLFESVRDIRGSGRVASKPLPGVTWPPRLAFDPDRLRTVVNVVATMWVGFAIWVWVDPPGHANFWYQATLWAMLGGLARTTLVSLVPGFVYGLLVGGVAYVLVMPHLSGYTELGLLLFGVTAGVFYLLWDARAIRSQTLALFLIVTTVENHQSYSFASYANTAAAVLLTLALAIACSYFPSSPRPEKVFLRLLTRYFRRAEILMSRLAPDGDRTSGFAGRVRRQVYRGDLLAIAQKLLVLADRIDYRLLPGTRPEHVRALGANLLSLSLRIGELLEAREHVEPDPRLEEVVTELREWRLLAQRQFRLWADDPAAALDPGADLGERLHARLARIEDALEQGRGRAAGQGPPLDYPALYRYLGGFRGLSEAAIGYAGVSTSVDWDPWREARF